MNILFIKLLQSGLIEYAADKLLRKATHKVKQLIDNETSGINEEEYKEIEDGIVHARKVLHDAKAFRKRIKSAK